MLTAAVEPDLRAFRKRKCIRVDAKPVEITWEVRKAAISRSAEGNAAFLFSGVIRARHALQLRWI
jgi:hypothetical protein